MSDAETDEVVLSGESVPEERLSQNKDFMRLWGGNSVSMVGTVISQVTIPLVAVLNLGVSPTQLGLISAAQLAPILVVGPILGHLVDSIPRRPVLIGTSLARAVLLALLAVLVVTDVLGFWSLVMCALALGTLSSMFEVAWYAYFPSVVPARHLVAANSRVQTSYSVAQVAGAGLGGWLMKVLSPAIALGLDSLTYLYAAVSFASVRTPEKREERTDAQDSFVRRFTAGFRVLWRERVLRAMLLEGAWFNFCEQAFVTVFMVFAVRELGMTTDVIGLCIGLGSIGAVAGSLAADWVGRWIGQVRVLVLGLGAASFGPLLTPLAEGNGWSTSVLVVSSFCCYGFGLTIYNIYSITERQRRVHASAMGRASAAFRTMAFGAMPLGAIFGGALATVTGARTALVVIGALLIGAWVVFSVAITRLLGGGQVDGGTP